MNVSSVVNNSNNVGNLESLNQLNTIKKFTDSTSVLNKTKSVDFAELLNKSIDKIDNAQKLSQKYDELVITGEIENLHEVMIAAQKAEILFSFGMEIRSQILDAYREIMRLQL